MKLPSDEVAQLSMQNGWNMTSTSTERVHFYSCDQGRDLINKVICFIDRQSIHHYHLFV